MRNPCDLLVVGGGIMGLWTARHAVAAGLAVTVVEKAVCGAGASGGVVGALMPYLPTGWNTKKQFQLDALVSLEQALGELEAETGRATGYRRCGRLIPIRREGFGAEAMRRVDASRVNWADQNDSFRQEVLPAGAFGAWIAADAAPFGLLHDNLSARLNPAATIVALQVGLEGRAQVLENCTFETFDAAAGIARCIGCPDIATSAVVLAAGYHAYPMLQKLTGREIGSGIKGQAAVFGTGKVDATPLIFDDGTYVIAHDDGTVAVGSTTEKHWRDATTPDHQVDRLIARARELCPVLREAPVIRTWAGVRPKNHLREPVVGRLPGCDRAWVATGGYKISFGIAHRLAQWLVGELTGSAAGIDLPATFTVEHHFRSIDGVT
jgi:glycine/D-amino acid oxidase-like deaminating enzyme